MRSLGTKCRRTRISRRQLLSASLQIGSAAVFLRSFLPKEARATSLLERSDNVHIRVLAEALRATGKSVCLNFAAQLDALGMNASSFDLHLRRAGLSRQDAVNIAVAIKGFPGLIAPSMESFSVSYNPDIEGAGAIALIRSLPASTTEIGLVGCGLRDESGKVLFDWMEQAPSLRMLCVEGNEFSPQMRGRFSKLRGSRSDLLVIT